MSSSSTPVKLSGKVTTLLGNAKLKPLTPAAINDTTAKIATAKASIETPSILNFLFCFFLCCC